LRVRLLPPAPSPSESTTIRTAAAALLVAIAAGTAGGGEPEAPAGVRFVDVPFERALAEAAEAKKPVFVYFTLDG
jgi:hypothetical protein